MIIYACSSNRWKLNELVTMGREWDLLDITIEPLPGLRKIPPPEENGITLQEIAINKARYYSTFTSECVLTDDSGLEVSALDMKPGIYSARFAGPDATDSANNELLLRKLENEENREAFFECCLALARAGRMLTTQTGIVRGEILRAPRGEKGFGYDPLFFYPPLGRTFAELTLGDKLEVSHRGWAFRHLFTYLISSSKRRRKLFHKRALLSDKIE